MLLVGVGLRWGQLNASRAEVAGWPEQFGEPAKLPQLEASPFLDFPAYLRLLDKPLYSLNQRFRSQLVWKRCCPFWHKLFWVCVLEFKRISCCCSVSHVQLFAIPGLQHTRLPCPSPSPGACSKSRPLSRWYRPIISSSVAPFTSRFQSFPASGSFPVNQLFTSGGQSIGASASAPVLSMNIQGWLPLGLMGLLSLLSKGLLKKKKGLVCIAQTMEDGR